MNKFVSAIALIFALAACSGNKCKVDGIVIPEGNPLVIPPELRPASLSSADKRAINAMMDSEKSQAAREEELLNTKWTVYESDVMMGPQQTQPALGMEPF